ncbi:MAG: radical SAM family heme chaperone HemW [Paludibacteraceae bacterium]
MSGIYLHIPFCKTKCTYCDFYSGGDFRIKHRVLKAMQSEISERKNYLSDKNVSTIYFGGGTPSVLSADEIQIFLSEIEKYFTISPDAEITLETNPDDLSFEYLNSIKQVGINRLSIGIQSFNDEQLVFVKRRHNAIQATKSIQNAQQAGFDNISIDLIYGLPGQSIVSWEEQLETTLQLNIQHLSAYGLTYETGTKLWKQLRQGKVTATDDETIVKMYRMLVGKFNKDDFEQYEISNFAKKGFRSRHNSAYWQQTPYLGIGPSAHSYNGNSRQWNIANMLVYSKNIENEISYFEREELTENDRFNDYIIIRLRTTEGIELEEAKSLFDEKMFQHLLESSKKHILNKLLIRQNSRLFMTQSGILVSNRIIEDMMIV